MTHYLLTVQGPAERSEYGNYSSKDEMVEAFAATGSFSDRLRADGYWVFASGLQPASTATVVDGKGDAPVMTDGPYLETKAVIGGFWVIDAPDLTSRSSSQPTGPRRAGARSRSVRSKVPPEPAERE